MTTVTTLFGLALAPLYSAIAEVESGNGTTSGNVYQISEIFVDDVNKVYFDKCLANAVAYRPLKYDSVLDRRTSEAMMAMYWDHYGKAYERETGKKVTYEVLARIHNGGPSGWKRSCTMGYWHKVERQLENALNGGRK